MHIPFGLPQAAELKLGPTARIYHQADRQLNGVIDTHLVQATTIQLGRRHSHLDLHTRSNCALRVTQHCIHHTGSNNCACGRFLFEKYRGSYLRNDAFGLSASSWSGRTSETLVASRTMSHADSWVFSYLRWRAPASIKCFQDISSNRDNLLATMPLFFTMSHIVVTNRTRPAVSASHNWPNRLTFFHHHHHHQDNGDDDPSTQCDDVEVDCPITTRTTTVTTLHASTNTTTTLRMRCM